MEYRIRKLRVSEIRLLRTFLYEAIYQPSSKGKLPVNVIDTPELYLYINCLLYTSDAADEEDSADFGDRRS